MIQPFTVPLLVQLDVLILRLWQASCKVGVACNEINARARTHTTHAWPCRSVRAHTSHRDAGRRRAVVCHKTKVRQPCYTTPPARLSGSVGTCGGCASARPCAPSRIKEASYHGGGWCDAPVWPTAQALRVREVASSFVRANTPTGRIRVLVLRPSHVCTESSLAMQMESLNVSPDRCF